MGYHITVAGAFRLTPDADERARQHVARSGRGWRLSPDGAWLDLPESHPQAFEALASLLQSVLPALGLAASGALDWQGEDGATGRVSVGPEGVRVEWPPEESRLAASEVAGVVSRLATGTKDERLEAAEILEEFQVSTRAALNALAHALADPDLEVRVRVANVLTVLGPRAAPAVDALSRALDDPELWMQAAAAEALGAIGPGAASALPALERLTHHPSYGPAGRAGVAIALIGGGPEESENAT